MKRKEIKRQKKEIKRQKKEIKRKKKEIKKGKMVKGTQRQTDRKHTKA
jgi:hypothetical protein